MNSHVYTEEELSAMHKALHRACGMPSLSMSYGDQDAWRVVIAVMQPLEFDTEEGRFTLQDLIEALAAMNKANTQRDARYRYTMRPSAIMRDPERLRDLVLECREIKRRRKRVVKPHTHTVRDAQGEVTIREDRAVDHDPVSLTDLVNQEMQRVNTQ